MPLDRNQLVQSFIDLQRAGLRLPPGPALEALVAELAASTPAPTLEDVLFRLAAIGRYGSLEPPRTAVPYDLDVFELDDYERADDDVYADIVARLAGLLGADLPLEILGASQSGLLVALDGQRYHFGYEVQDDWVDGLVFSDVAALLVRRGASKRLVHAYGGQLFVAVPVEHLHTLAALVRRHLEADHPELADAYRVRHVTATDARLERARQRAEHR